MVSISVVTAVSAHAEAAVATALGSSPDLRVVRRCPDVADLLAVTQSGRAQVAVVSPDLPGVRRSLLADLRASGVEVVGVFDPSDETQERVLRQWDVGWVVSVHSTTALVDQVRAAAEGNRPVVTDPAEEIGQLEELIRDGDPAADDDLAAIAALETDVEPEGQIVAVWGPVGAPGRTTVAVNLAAELARAGKSVLVVDADTYGACVGQWLALLDEAPGIAAAVRLAESGRLDVVSLAAVAPVVLPQLRVLTGISHAARWPEISEEALTEVLRTARSMTDFVIVDCAASIEQDEELSYDTVAPRRNAATLASIGVADLVLAVGSADPVGLQRLVRALQEVGPVMHDEPRVVVTRLRASAVGTSPRMKVSQALTRFAGVREPVLIPEDREGIDAALLSGTVLAGSCPNSPARLAIADLAAEISGLPPTRRRHRLASLRRTGRSI